MTVLPDNKRDGMFHFSFVYFFYFFLRNSLTDVPRSGGGEVESTISLEYGERRGQFYYMAALGWGRMLYGRVFSVLNSIRCGQPKKEAYAELSVFPIRFPKCLTLPPSYRLLQSILSGVSE